MKKIAGIVALAFAAVLTSCGGADSDSSPFVGKIDFKAEAMGMNTNGSITMDAENERMTYRIDAIEQFMGMDVAMMVDMKNNMVYTICPSKDIYMETAMEKDDVNRELPSKEDVEEAKKEFFSKLEKTGNTKEINGVKCEEYKLKEKVEDLESATIWVSKSMLDRMTMNLEMMEELKKLGADELMIGFPMKGTFTVDGKSGSFEVTKITEGKDALTDFDLSKMEKLDEMAFSKKLMEGTSWGDMMGEFENLGEGTTDDFEGSMEDLEKSLKELEKMDIDSKELEKLLEGMK